MGPGYRILGCQVAAINMPPKKNKTPTPSKEEYEDLAIEYEQQKRQNEQTTLLLEAKDQELQQQGDRMQWNRTLLSVRLERQKSRVVSLRKPRSRWRSSGECWRSKRMLEAEAG